VSQSGLVMGNTLASGGETRVSITAEWRGVGGLGGATRLRPMPEARRRSLGSELFLQVRTVGPHLARDRRLVAFDGQPAALIVAVLGSPGTSKKTWTRRPRTQAALPSPDLCPPF
jgi:hypothetical protein